MKTNDIKHAVDILAGGGTVVYPTETLYGLGALATDKRAVRKVYAIKRRPKERLLPVIVGSRAQGEKYFIFNRTERSLADSFWPGPLSLVLKAKSKKITRAIGSNAIAVRYPSNSVAAMLARLSGVPITSTSSNISGKPGCFTIAAVKKQFAGSKRMAYPDLFLNGGTLKNSLPSTIIQVRGRDLLVIREGKIPLAKIAKEAARFFMQIRGRNQS